jgi:hypothetical protein
VGYENAPLRTNRLHRHILRVSMTPRSDVAEIDTRSLLLDKTYAIDLAGLLLLPIKVERASVASQVVLVRRSRDAERSVKD